MGQICQEALSRREEYFYMKHIQIYVTYCLIAIRLAKIKLKSLGDFPGGPVVKNLPSNTGDMSLIPNRGTKIPHAAE